VALPWEALPEIASFFIFLLWDFLCIITLSVVALYLLAFTISANGFRAARAGSLLNFSILAGL